ncbi:MAG: chorismate synthase [Chloroflexota bacterium]
MTEFRFLTAGESHGRGLVMVIDGIVAGLRLNEAFIERDLRRRQGGYGRGERMKIEADHAEIISGVRHGRTMGSPISLVIWNRDWENWMDVMSVAGRETGKGRITRPRPGHADLAGVFKYGLKDIRPVLERSSARETAARVAVGAVARRFLEEFGISIHSRTLAIGRVHAGDGRQPDWDAVEASPVRCADARAGKKMMKAIDSAKADGDTLGGVFEVITDGIPVGLGSHVHWDRRLDGRIAQAVMSIPSVKMVEIGSGSLLAASRGSGAHDSILPGSGDVSRPWRRASNHAGGLEGGMTNGEPVVVRAAVKPISTLSKPLDSIDLTTGNKTKAHFERADICIVPAAGVISEAMLAIVLASALLEKFGGDSLRETLAAYRRYTRSLVLF